MPERLTILLIDDSATDLLFAEAAFDHSAARAQLITRTSGAEALEYLQGEEQPMPDVVITDLNMPGMSGLDVIRVMKTDPRLNLIPVVVLSTSDRPEDIGAAYSLHASSYLVKAADFQGFVQQVEVFLAFWQNAKFARDQSAMS